MAYITDQNAGGLDTLDDSTIATGDLVIVGDVSDSNRAKGITWANIKLALNYALKGLATASGLTMGTAKILGRATAGTGAIEEIAVTGSGSVVLATSPTLVTPLLGTPTSGVLTNATGYTVANLSGAATGVLTFLATPSSANLATAITDETGSGALVFGTAPTLAKPVINGTNPTAATYAPASGSQTVALDCAANNMHFVTGNASGTAITFTIANATNNQPFIVSILQGSGTVSTITGWFATVRWAGDVTPTLTATLNKRDTFGFIRTGSNTYDGFVIGQAC